METKAQESRVAVISIIVQDEDSVPKLNALLHEYKCGIIGRLGIPYHQKGVNVICVVMDAPQDAISALSGKIGRLPGVNTKTAYSNVPQK